MRIDFTSRYTLALLAANTVIGLIVALQLFFPTAPSADEGAVLPDAETSLPEFGGEALNPPALADLDDMLERPLFYDNRRMPEPPKVETPPPPPKPLMLKLQGIALAGGSRVAVLRNTSNNLILQLVEGETHDGWTLDEITTTSARFSRGAQSTELLLEQENTNPRRR